MFSDEFIITPVALKSDHNISKNKTKIIKIELNRLKKKKIKKKENEREGSEGSIGVL